MAAGESGIFEAMAAALYNEPVPIPRGGVHFPLELIPPSGFRGIDRATWPEVEGRLEYVAGRLLYMPPCGDDQQDVAASIMGILEPWALQERDFVAAGNEAGMLLGGEVRAADGAIWRKADLSGRTGGFRRVPPLLSAEVAGKDESEDLLREKARWYLDRGVKVVWIALPATREVIVLRMDREARYGEGQTIAPEAELPGLTPPVARFFWQLT
jgi:Uma2 family endonuclease